MQLLKAGTGDEEREDAGAVWIDVDLNRPEAERWLSEHPELAEATDSLLGDASVSSRRVRIADGLAMRLCYTTPDQDGAGGESPIRLGLVVVGDRLVSLRRGPVRELEEIWDRIGCGAIEVDQSWSAVTALLWQIADRVDTKLDHLSTTLDELEDVVFDSVKELPIETLGQTRRRLIRDRRHISAFCRTMDDLSDDPSQGAHFPKGDALGPVQQAMERYERTAAFYLERANLLHDQIQSQLSDRMNVATLRLGVVATVFLPLGFLTGLLGINVAGIPGTHDPKAFWLVCLLLSFLALLAWGVVARFYRS